jgi:hypothetical protein
LICAVKEEEKTENKRGNPLLTEEKTKVFYISQNTYY